MAKGDNRLKVLYVVDIFKKNSKQKSLDDKNRFLSANTLIQILHDEYELNADRKSIYSYIQSMEQYGFEFDKSKKGYYLISCPDDDHKKYSFETAELKMIADALTLSHFYPVKKTRQMIKKLEHLMPENGNSLQNNAIFLENVNKSENPSVVYNIDSVCQAIDQDKQIIFHYYNIKPELNSGNNRFITEYREENGQPKKYLQSPYSLIWKNDGYYLLTYDSAKKDMCTFRVDRMCDVIVLNGKDNDIENKPRDGHSFFSKINITEYSNTAFDMFGGEKTDISLRVKKNLAKVIVDKFGKNVSIYKDKFDDDYFLCSTKVQKSNMFYSWVSGFGNDIQITYPEDVRQDYIEYLKNILNGYQNLNELEEKSKK